jgi:4-amino-4-deoxy-L-arabinose transferase-like glycosyltransferase
MPNERKTIIALVLVGLAFRAAFILFFADLSLDSYWEYGEIARNLHLGKGYSLFHNEGGRYEFHSSPSASPYPSAYMMPGYVALLYPFFFLNDVTLRNVLLLLLQGLIGGGCVVLIYRFTARFMGRRDALAAAALMACLPEFVYASGSSTPTVLFHLLLLALLPVLYDLWNADSLRAELAAGALFAALVYIRPETALFAAAVLAGLLLAGRARSALRLGIVITLLVSPWQIRNAVVFHEWIPFTTNGGLNFFRGHNDLQLGTFADDVIIQGLRDLPQGREFEPEMSRLYISRAFQYIAEEPSHELAHDAEKFLQLWFWNSDDPRSANPLYRVPWLILLGAGGFGMVRTKAWSRHRILVLYLVCATTVAILFFVLPRYQTMMKVALLPFAGAGVVSVWDTLKRKWEGTGGRHD